MNNILVKLVMALALAFALPLQADDYITSVFNTSANGTASATVFVPRGAGIAHITDVSYDLDTLVTTGTIDIHQAESEQSITSATASGSVLWFDNDTPTHVAALEYVIFYDVSTNTYYLYRTTASAATSVTIQETLSAATTTADKIYPCKAVSRRHAPNVVSSTLGVADIWLPSDLPSALTLDGNTTSCRLSISGVRIKN